MQKKTPSSKTTVAGKRKSAEPKLTPQPGASTKAKVSKNTAKPQEPKKDQVTEASPVPDRASGARDLLSGFAGGTSRVVQKAVSILEEEIAAGIVAAKQMEEKFLDVKTLREGNSADVIQRFRKDAHEVVDILMDLVAVTTRSIGSMADRLIRLEDQTSTPVGPNGVPTLRVVSPVQAGKEGTVPMALENESDNDTEEFEFHASDLVNAQGDRISAEQIRFTPERLKISARGKEHVTIVVTPSEGTPKGTYAGLVQAAKLDQLRAVLVVSVE